MRNVRTDLAMEAREILGDSGKLHGVISEEKRVLGHLVHRVEIINADGEEKLGKPQGNYITIQLNGIARREEEVFPRGIKVVAEELKKLMPRGEGCVLVAGLGNRAITPDAVGDAAVAKVMVTRHLVETLPEYFGTLGKVSAITPGVLGMTGVESKEIIEGVAGKVRPYCIIVIDALASCRIERLCNTIQITDTGITPGSGVGNSRAAINKETMGVPVIAIGVPTVVDISSVIFNIEEKLGTTFPEHVVDEFGKSLMVTPKEIDVNIEDVAKIIGYAINTVLHPNVTIGDMDMFLS